MSTRMRDPAGFALPRFYNFSVREVLEGERSSEGMPAPNALPISSDLPTKVIQRSQSMAAPLPLTDHQLLTTTSNGCLETEDVYGDALADIPNIVVFVNLSTTTPLLHCISWYDLRATLEPPDVPLRERVRLWRSDERVPANYVYRVLDRWFDPALEPMTRYYNTFLLYDSYEARVGTQLAVSALHGATERLHRVRPVHRRDVVAYVRGELSVAEFRARVAATVGGLPDAPAATPVIFEPELEDAVRPAMLYEGDHIVLARPFEGKPFGHATVWQRGQSDYHATYDGSLGVGERRAVVEGDMEGDMEGGMEEEVPLTVDDPSLNDDGIIESTMSSEEAHNAWVAQFRARSAARYNISRATSMASRAAIARVDARMAAREAAYQASVASRMTFRIPGQRDEFIAEFDAAGNETESNIPIPFAREMAVTIDGTTYFLHPRFGSEVVRRGEYGEVAELRETLTLGEETPFTGDPARWAALTRLIESARRPDIARVRREGTLVLQFTDGVDVYEYTKPDGTVEYVYMEGTHPSLYPVLATGLWEFTRPGIGRGRVLLDSHDNPHYFAYDNAHCHFRAARELPDVISALLAANPTTDGIHTRTYLLGDMGWYLVIAGIPYSLSAGYAVYPSNNERLEVWDDGIYWDYDQATRGLLPQGAVTHRYPRSAPAELSSLLQALRSPASFMVRYAGDGPLFRVHHADGRYYSSFVPQGTRRDEAFDATITTIPPLFVRRYGVTHGRITTYVELPVTLPATWEELAADLETRHPRVARLPDFMRLLHRQYDQYLRDGAPMTDARVLSDGGTMYEIGVVDGVLREQCPLVS